MQRMRSRKCKRYFHILVAKPGKPGGSLDHINKTEHKAYVEACCGSAAVFFAKKPSKIEILNDLDQRFSLLFSGPA